MANNRVLTGAIAIIKVSTPTGQKVVGLMRDLRISESFRRQEVRGLGTILPTEAPVTEWRGTVSCSFFEIDWRKSGLERAVRRDVGSGNAASQIANGSQILNFEDNLVLDDLGVTLNVYKKISDVGSPDPTTGLIIPQVEPYCIITRCLIESENINVSEGTISGRDQSFVYLDPIVFDA